MINKKINKVDYFSHLNIELNKINKDLENVKKAYEKSLKNIENTKEKIDFVNNEKIKSAYIKCLINFNRIKNIEFKQIQKLENKKFVLLEQQKKLIQNF